MQREAIIEKIEIRQKQFETGKLIELNWRDQWVQRLVNWYDVIKRAREVIESRESKWSRIIKRVLRLTEAVIIIAAGHYAKKLPIRF